MDDPDASAGQNSVLDPARRKSRPKKTTRLLREQDEAITSDQLTAQINAVPKTDRRRPRRT